MFWTFFPTGLRLKIPHSVWKPCCIIGTEEKTKTKVKWDAFLFLFYYFCDLFLLLFRSQT